MNAIINQEQMLNYTVEILDKNSDIGINKFKGKRSDFMKFCGFDDFFDSKVEIMDVVNKRLQSISPSSCKVEKESELVGMLSKQLYLAGNQMQRMQAVLKKAEERLKTKDQEIGRLKRKIREWEVKNRTQESIYKREIQKRQQQIEGAESMQKKCHKLETKVCEMEKFLADYGLAWVGENHPRTSKKTPEIANGFSDFIDGCYPQLMSNIQELNMSMGKDEMQVHRSQQGAIFKAPSCLTLKFYKNGMIVKNGRLRPYTDSRTKSFIQDILDGYFPSELQQDYPSGVPFKIEDHKLDMYLGEGASYPGQGYQLGRLSRIASTASFKAKGPKRVQTPKEKIRSNTSLSRESFGARGSNDETTIGGLKRPSSARTPEVDVFDLRSQILASHNNNCSDVHLQSHINAELAVTSRSEKKSQLIPNTPECNLPPQLAEPIKNQRHNSYRSSIHVSPSGRGDSQTRARSASASGSRFFQGRPVSRSKKDQVVGIPMNYEKNSRKNRVRGSKSATHEKPKSELPIIRQLNLPTGASGELQLKVRSLNGGTVYLLHISTDDTVSHLYQLLDKAIFTSRKRQNASYKIVISGYAPRRLDHMGISLRDYGICQNSVLHLIND